MRKIPKIILLIETSRVYSRGLLRGIARYSNLHGPWNILRNPPNYVSYASRKAAFSKLKNWNADGIIIREPRENSVFTTMGLPTIISPHILKENPNLPVIVSDSVTAGKMAAEHLLNCGLQQFAFCGFDDMRWLWSQEREKSFTERIAEAGFETHIYRQPASRSKRLWQNEQDILGDWLKSLPKPVGLMACNDDRGEQIIWICKVSGLRIPDEVAIIGVDNDKLICNLSDPPLSSIHLNAEKAGYEAAELLDKLMAGEEMKGQRLSSHATHVVPRTSTDILTIPDRNLSRAIQFIRKNAEKNIHVNDVVDKVPLSRRVLERKFRTLLNRSINEEIRRVRIDLISQKLIETDISISEMAFNLGYKTSDHIARYFRQEKSMSLKEYRKNNK